MKTPKSNTVIEAEELIKQYEEINGSTALTTQDAGKLLDICYKLLAKVEEITKSRDTWREKYEAVFL